MNSDDILLGLAGSLVLLYFGHLLIKGRKKRELIRNAQDSFRKAFQNERILFEAD